MANDLIDLIKTRRSVRSYTAEPVPEELLDQGIRPNTIRLSIGTEHADDLIADLKAGFAAAKG